ncbi:MAG: 9-O-acetylesterase [Planctomycetota bacterium]|nr:MAG: 9-O-acetylesterase [Planctomycetota bacterium]
MPRLRLAIAPFLLLAAAVPLPAQGLELPAVFGDHMVLQREDRVPFWGRAAAGAEVELRGSWSEDAVARAVADRDGRWRAELPTGPAGGPHTVTIRAGAERREFTDVLLGEVWLCGGQSNMEWPLGATAGAYGSEEEFRAILAAADRPTIRLFDVAHAFAWEPQEDCAGEWRPCRPDTASSFSAVGYHFGVELQEALGVPVGLIGCNWGGTLAEAWTSAEGLARREDFADALALVEELRRHPERAAWKREQRLAEWRRRFDEAEIGSRGGWMAEDFDDAGWPEMEQPATWGGSLSAFDGVVWLRREVELPAAWVGRDLVLELGPIDDMDTVWFNGRRVGETLEPGRWQQPRRYPVPAGLARAGRNLIAVRALDTGGIGGMNGQPGQLQIAPAGPGAGPALSLAGPWRWQKGSPVGDLPLRPQLDEFHPNSPTALFNGMLAPVAPFAIRGVIWYQGEANRLRPRQYRTLFPDLIRDWRRAFGRGDFPFLFVQLAPFAYDGDTGQAAELRDAQRRALGAVANTGMAVTLDIGDPGDIHPRNKADVGHRLALWALARTYGLDVGEYSGPLYYGMRGEGDRIRLFFEHAAGLTTRDGEPPSCFTIAGADRVFRPATAVIEGEQIVVSSPEVPFPQFVRFAAGAADQPNLVNGAGLPAASFDTGG